jgi:hypothetical protein
VFALLPQQYTQTCCSAQGILSGHRRVCSIGFAPGSEMVLVENGKGLAQAGISSTIAQIK